MWIKCPQTHKGAECCPVVLLNVNRVLYFMPIDYGDHVDVTAIVDENARPQLQPAVCTCKTMTEAVNAIDTLFSHIKRGSNQLVIDARTLIGGAA